jgi:hypothetical protein
MALASLEYQRVRLSWDSDLSGHPLPDAEGPKATQLDLFAAVESLNNILEYFLDDYFRVLLRQLSGPSHFFH